MCVSLQLSLHRGKQCVTVQFPYTHALKEYIRHYSGISWSKTLGTFYFDFSYEEVSQFTQYLKDGGYALQQLPVATSPPRKSVLLPVLSSEGKKICAQYQDYLIGKRYSHNTQLVYGKFVSEFLRFTHPKPLDTLTEDDVRLYVEWGVKSRGYSVSTHRQLIGALKHFAFFYPACAIHPDQLERPKKVQKLPTVLSMEEVMRLLMVTKNIKHRTILALLYSCGLRIGEVLQLKNHHFDFERDLVQVEQGKGRKDRYVPLAKNVKPLLRTYYHSYQPSNYFIEGKNKQAYSPGSVRSFLKEYCKLASITKRVGSKLLEFISYRTDDNGQIEKEVINKPIELDVFKWETNNPYRYSSETTEEYYGKVIFEKKREFIEEVKVTVLGKEYKALKFQGFYKTEVPKTKKKYEYSQFSYYAKGLGLVKMEKEYSDGTKLTLELTEIISNSDWSKRQKLTMANATAASWFRAENFLTLLKTKSSGTI